eukprot:tig00000492_g1388.t1
MMSAQWSPGAAGLETETTYMPGCGGGGTGPAPPASLCVLTQDGGELREGRAGDPRLWRGRRERQPRLALGASVAMRSLERDHLRPAETFSVWAGRHPLADENTQVAKREMAPQQVAGLVAPVQVLPERAADRPAPPARPWASRWGSDLPTAFRDLLPDPALGAGPMDRSAVPARMREPMQLPLRDQVPLFPVGAQVAPPPPAGAYTAPDRAATILHPDPERVMQTAPPVVPGYTLGDASFILNNGTAGGPPRDADPNAPPHLALPPLRAELRPDTIEPCRGPRPAPPADVHARPNRVLVLPADPGGPPGAPLRQEAPEEAAAAEPQRRRQRLAPDHERRRALFQYVLRPESAPEDLAFAASFLVRADTVLSLTSRRQPGGAGQQQQQQQQQPPLAVGLPPPTSSTSPTRLPRAWPPGGRAPGLRACVAVVVIHERTLDGTWARWHLPHDGTRPFEVTDETVVFLLDGAIGKG